MKQLVTADLHLDVQPKNDYRWDFLTKWIPSQDFTDLVILGDLTEEKDRHSSALVNRIITAFSFLIEEGRRIHLLRGNHDYVNPSEPFFRFLSVMPQCHYYSEPKLVEIGNTRWGFFPHEKRPGWELAERLCDVGIDFVGCHQLFTGAVGESGKTLNGVGHHFLNGAYKVWAGDIHTPQKVGPVEYVGAPYPVRFGDSFEPRVVVIDNKRWRNLYPPSIKRLVLQISSPDEIEYTNEWNPGDQIKVELSLKRSEFGLWEKYRKKIQRICRRTDLILCGIELKEKKRQRLSLISTTNIPRAPLDQFESFVESTGVGSADAEVGRGLLE